MTKLPQNLRAMHTDAYAFCERAKKYELLLVPSDSFGFPGYVRLAYCVAYDTIERALPAFRALVDAGVEAVMGAYNRTNGEPCCGSKSLIVDLLRGEWYFREELTGHGVSFLL